jgi:hypothetical protein
MDCACFRLSYDRWWNQGPVDNKYPEGQAEWFRHRQDCRDCEDWAKRQYCLSRGIQPEHHCCLDMAYAISHPIEIGHQGLGRVLDWFASWDEYRIPMPYDGYSSTLIRHCPFCGYRLPKSKRQLWYERLCSMGFDDPDNDDLPSEFETDQWWRGSNRNF